MASFVFTHETSFKTITYCLMHFTVAIAVAFALTGNWVLALSIGIIEPLVQTVFFNMHERSWNKARSAYHRKFMDSGLSAAG